VLLISPGAAAAPRLAWSLRPRRGLQGCTLVALALSAACGTSDAAERRPPPAREWTAPAVIPGGAFLSPRNRLEDVVAEPGGAVHAVFTDTRGPLRRWNRVLYARLAGGAWSEPVPLDDTPGRSHAPRLAADGRRRLHALWWEGLDPESGSRLLHRASDGAGWGPVDTLYREADPRGVSDLQLAAVADGSGRLHVVHARAEGGHGYLVLDGGRWRAGPAPALGGGYLRWDREAARAGRLELAYVAAVASEEVRTANNDLWFRSLGRAGWREPAAVYRAPSRSHDPTLLTGADGVRHAVWTERTVRGASERLLHSVSRDGVHWSPPTEVVPPSPGAGFYAPRLGVDGEGRLHLAFLRASAREVVPLETRLEAGLWTAPRPLAPGAPAGTLDLELAGDGRGTLHALWRGADGRYRHSRLGG
jgi:hypothetical protein